MASKKYWKMLDNAPAGTTETTALINWSMNCDYPTPFNLFMDITGISEEEYGERLCGEKLPNMGYMEIGYLADALVEYSENPSRVKKWLDKLLREESK